VMEREEHKRGIEGPVGEWKPRAVVVISSSPGSPELIPRQSWHGHLECVTIWILAERTTTPRKPRGVRVELPSAPRSAARPDPASAESSKRARYRSPELALMPLVDESADGPAIAKCDHGQEACQPMLSRCQGLRPRSGLLRSPVGAWRIRDLDSPSGPRDSGKAANLLCRPTCLKSGTCPHRRRGSNAHTEEGEHKWVGDLAAAQHDSLFSSSADPRPRHSVSRSVGRPRIVTKTRTLTMPAGAVNAGFWDTLVSQRYVARNSITHSMEISHV